MGLPALPGKELPEGGAALAPPFIKTFTEDPGMRPTSQGLNPEPKQERNARGRFAWLRSRWVILPVLACLGVAFVLWGNGSSQASLERGNAASQLQKGQFSPRAYQFTGQGKVLGGAGGTWIVGGVPVAVSAQAQVRGVIHPGDPVSLLGHITQTGEWVAERVLPISEDDSFFSFAGPLDARGEKTWQVAGIPLAVDEKTLLGQAIQPGELVLATFRVTADHTWLALQIQALSALAADPTATATPAPTASPTPTLTATAPPITAPAVVKPAPKEQKPPKPEPKNKKKPKENNKPKDKKKHGGN